MCTGTAGRFIHNTLDIPFKEGWRLVEEMYQNVFRKCFQMQLLLNMNCCSTTDIDSVSYYTVRVDKALIPTSQKERIISWLEWNCVNADFSMIKALVDENKPSEKYIIDDRTTCHGHEVNHLPPYHCHFKPRLYMGSYKKFSSKRK